MLFAVIDKPGRADAGGSGRGDPRDHPRLPVAQVDALGQGVVLDREPALGAPAAGHRRAVRRRRGADRDRRHRRAAATTRRPSLPPAPARSRSRRADDYAATLRACHVIVDQRRAPRDRRATARRGGRRRRRLRRWSRTRGWCIENAGLTEWPVPLLGRFDPAFLDVPPEVIQLTMRTNQKYFACVDGEGKLATGLRLHRQHRGGDGGKEIVEGNAQGAGGAAVATRASSGSRTSRCRSPSRRRSSTRSSSTRSSAPLPTRSSAWPSWRAGWWSEGIVETGGSDHRRRGRAADDEALADLAEQAARLAKADLVTGMVGEFPELQGVMGGYYARARRPARRSRRRDPRSLQAGRAGRRRAHRAGDGGGELGGQAGYVSLASSSSMKRLLAQKIRSRCGEPHWASDFCANVLQNCALAVSARANAVASASRRCDGDDLDDECSTRRRLSRCFGIRQR